MVKRVTPDGELVDMTNDVPVRLNPFLLPRAPGTYDSDAVSNATGYKETMPSLTEQADEPAANINRMLERLGIEEVMAQGYAGPFQADFTAAPGSFQEAFDLVKRGQDSFQELPAKVRARFNNRPEELLEFLERNDEEAIDEAVRLGLIEKRPSASVAAAAGAANPTPPAGTPAAPPGTPV